MSAATHVPPAAAGAAVLGHGRLAGAKARAVSLPVVASTAVTCALGALMPPGPGLALFTTGLLIAGALMFDTVEPIAVRLLYGGSPPTAADQRVLAPVVTVLCPHGLGPPLVDIWVRPGGPANDVTATGRRSVLITRGLLEAISSGAISVERATALLAREAGLVRAGATRCDPVVRFWTTPWVLLGATTVGVARFLGVAALVRVMWRARGLVTAVAVVQAVAAGHGGLAVLLIAVGATSYLWPRWMRAWQGRLTQIGDEAVARVGTATPPAEGGLALGNWQSPTAVAARGGNPAPRRHLRVVR